MRSPLVALTVAGTDSGGAAGVAADLATFAALGAHGTCAVTAVTAQDTTGVHAVVHLSADHVRAQVDAVLDDLPVAVAKAGMLGSAEIAGVVADLPPGLPLVVDPVLRTTSGSVLADDALVAAYRDHILPRCTVVTPNLAEARRLAGAGSEEPLEHVARALQALGPAVVLTGGDPESDWCRDFVVDDRGRAHVLEHPGVPTTNDHGTGCTFSAALAVHLARGEALPAATRSAQAFVAAALRRSAGWRLGRGRGPVAHTFAHPTTNPSPQEA
ncbi:MULTISPECIES: bifunctional hydroxymethylpyrimidine kinase/phosphomethylpyrimidine kinase [unclassified Nocardioides]|uniref:bifunctional hydroxymethylpyrimidine kinase/phosphomethylpyrimidine kinase n=1 Tax=unclassified Nocardioides TaxID=2615069 RepID=UPI000056FD78|nr:MULTISPECIES: bifunctional hydroxymethylpyrimidine kinase/phosphomethylpyrimidine kinase [unclassified Nocardioides]ABL82901.1 phosphomethylpyrimidine kinase / hydroxymethylpyrimidine kinase [Nocardioides sp. JS614]